VVFCAKIKKDLAKKLFLLAGEASGDLHGAGVVRQLLTRLPDLDVFGIGGNHLKSLGMRQLYHAEQVNVMGFVEVARHFSFLRGVLNHVKSAVRHEQPDAALLIDYPGMNLRLAEFLCGEGVPVIYYIAPQVWAWKENRVALLKKFVTRLLVVFEFEVEFFRARGVEATFVGHPILEELSELQLPSRLDFTRGLGVSEHQQFLGLLPGSRAQEVERMLPEMLRAASSLEKTFGLCSLLGVAPTIPASLYDRILSASSVQPHRVSAYETMQFSDLALVTSGTATLETLCFGTPMIVHYKTAALNYAIGKRLVKIQKIALANIIAEGLEGNKKLVPELIQQEMTAENITRTATQILRDPAALAETRSRLLAAKTNLGSLRPSVEVSRVILETLNS
jgi:lipid-A-disaccharide synthase